jgi:hypothetical protein
MVQVTLPLGLAQVGTDRVRQAQQRKEARRAALIKTTAGDFPHVLQRLGRVTEYRRSFFLSRLKNKVFPGCS